MAVALLSASFSKSRVSAAVIAEPAPVAKFFHSAELVHADSRVADFFGRSAPNRADYLSIKR